MSTATFFQKEGVDTCQRPLFFKDEGIDTCQRLGNRNKIGLEEWKMLDNHHRDDITVFFYEKNGGNMLAKQKYSLLLQPFTRITLFAIF